MNQLTPREKELLKYLKVAARYLHKAVADDLMSGCVVKPAHALKRIEAAIAAAEGETP